MVAQCALYPNHYAVQNDPQSQLSPDTSSLISFLTFSAHLHDGDADAMIFPNRLNRLTRVRMGGEIIFEVV